MKQEGSYIQLGVHRKDEVVLPFKENLWDDMKEQVRMKKVCHVADCCDVSPAHSLHHVCDKAVGDAWTGFLCEVEGVLQFLNGSYATTTGPTLLL